MHVTPVELVAALVFGTAASLVGGYLGGTSLAAKDIGREFAGYLGMLYGPTAGATGVLAGVIVVAVIATRS
jgi:hypothetical protein